MTDRPDNSTEDRPVYAGGVEAASLDFSSGEAFWDRLAAIEVESGPDAHLDAAMAGRPAPRTWLFLHPAGRGGMSATAALTFARALARRGQSALVLDADETHGALTGWIGRTEQEGWIDLARYGTSVLTSGIPLPFEGKRSYVLGVGSFTPTDVTAEEIKALMARLRRQADDILITAPAHAAGLPWAEAADSRILCWDPATVGRSDNDRLAAEFADAGCPVTAVMAFGAIPPPGVDGPEDMLVEEVLSETSRKKPEPVHEGFDDEGVDEAESRVDAPQPVAAGEDPRADRWTEPGVAPTLPDSEPGRRSSNVFLFGGIAAVAVIVAAFVYWYQVLRVPSEGHFENVPAVTRARIDGTGPDGPPAGSAGDGEVGAGDRLAAADTVAGVGAGAGPDSVPVATGSVEAAGGDGTEAAEPAPEDPAEVVPEQPATPAASEDAVPAPEEEAPKTASFDMAPFRVPVGTQGWALHVFSLPSFDSLQAEVGRLERRGFRTAVRAVDVEGKGRWYRIFLGNFPSRAAAEAAKPGLLAELGADYAAAKRFQPAAAGE